MSNANTVIEVNVGERAVEAIEEAEEVNEFEPNGLEMKVDDDVFIRFFR